MFTKLWDFLKHFPAGLPHFRPHLTQKSLTKLYNKFCMWDSRISIVNIEAGYSILYVQEGTDAGSCSIHLMSLQIPASHSTGQRNFRCGHWVLTLTMLREILQKNCWNITDNNGFININNVILQNILLFLTINLEMLAPISWWTKK